MIVITTTDREKFYGTVIMIVGEKLKLFKGHSVIKEFTILQIANIRTED